MFIFLIIFPICLFKSLRWQHGRHRQGKALGNDQLGDTRLQISCHDWAANDILIDGVLQLQPPIV